MLDLTPNQGRASEGPYRKALSLKGNLMSVLLKSWFGQLLASLGGYGLCIVLCVALFVVCVMGLALVKQIAASKPTIEWTTKNGSGRVNFPKRTARK